MSDAEGASLEEEHPSDAILRVRAPSLAALFAETARASFRLMTDLSTVERRLERAIDCAAANREELLVVWLNELIGIAGAEALFFSEFTIEAASETRIQARAEGEPVDPARHPLYKEVKAATYHHLAVTEIAGDWEATVLLDL